MSIPQTARDKQKSLPEWKTDWYLSNAILARH